jgi:alpha-L-rhamnosidase
MLVSQSTFLPSLLLLILTAGVPQSAQTTPPADPRGPHEQVFVRGVADPPSRVWHATWITHPTAPLRSPQVLHFRRSLTLASVPASYVIRVSADNRFILYVNGKRAGDGPARGDLTHWRYEHFDLAPLLQPGDNLITATVWNWGVFAPIAQMSDRTAFLLESEATGDASGAPGDRSSSPGSISTPGGWLVEIEPGQTPLPRSTLSYITYYASGPGEQLDASQYDWSWNSPSASGSNWVKPGDPMRDSAFPGTNRAHSSDTTGDNPWGLVPDELPHMQYSETSPGQAVRASQAKAVHVSAEPGFIQAEIQSQSLALNDFPGKSASIPARTQAHILLDRKTLTTAYPRLIASGGKGAKIRLTYSEALFDDKFHKADRDALDYTDAQGQKHDRQALGLNDLFLPDGGDHRVFEPLWWRTWRYLDLDIETADQPLTLESLTANFTAYPFEERAKLTTNDADLDKIWEISWRTARLDAHETYMDTPYYEQLQYIGDTRIQALISYTVAGDDRLARQALEAFNDSRIPEGITRSRYPSSLPQNIPTFSLLWIGMLHDWWMYRPDPAPVRESLQGTRSVLGWFAQHERPDGLLEKLPWWSFIDWVPSGETPTYDSHGESCITTLEYLGALNDAADLEQALGDPVLAGRYGDRASRVKSGIYDKCWNSGRNLLADNPDQKVFSQQANILGVLYDVIPADRQREVLKRMLAIQPGTTPNGTLSASYYFRFYLSRALEHAGMADEYLNSLQPWRQMLALHFSTWPEQPEPTRSDSHAWTAHPIYDLLTLVAGVEPASPGFKTVRIAPHLGNLPSLTASFPHPDGTIEVKYQKHGTGIDADITLPAQLTGEFMFNGKRQPLKPGVNHITME